MIVIIMGAAGAGKTTVGRALAEALGWRFIDAGLTKFVVRPAVPVTSRHDFLDQFCGELLPLQN